MKKIIVSSVIILFSPACFVLAGVEISEIMYDLKTGSDDGREWVEVYNNSEEIIDLATLKFFEADVNHKLTLVQGSTKIEAKGYAIIVSNFDKFKADWPNSSGNIFDSTFSLNNTGEYLAIKNEDKILDEYFYNSSFGGAGDGKSLQKINGVWTSSTPTPGSENKISYTPMPTPAAASNTTPKVVVASDKKQIVQADSTLEDLPPVPEVLNSVEMNESSSGSFVFIIIFLGLLGLSGGAAYFVQKKGKITENEDDFELLE